MFSKNSPRSATTEVPDRFVIIFDSADPATPGIVAEAREQRSSSTANRTGLLHQRVLPNVGHRGGHQQS